MCCRYKSPPNEVNTESTLTVMKIQLPTGVKAYLEDLKQVSGSFMVSVDQLNISYTDLQTCRQMIRVYVDHL